MLTIVPAFVLAQKSPIEWNISSIRNADSGYTLVAKMNITNGWHVYAETLKEEGLEGITLTWDNENIKKTGDASINPANTKFPDPVFDNKQIAVHTGTIEVSQKIAVTEPCTCNFKNHT